MVGRKGDKSFDSGLLWSDEALAFNQAITEMIARSKQVIKEDKLKNITGKEIYVMAVLDSLEEKLWVSENCKLPIVTLDERISRWKENIKFTQTNENWKDGRHEGDCTKVPMTCERCYCENHLETARKFMNWFNTGDYQNY
jgi:hypothetical protein